MIHHGCKLVANAILDAIQTKEVLPCCLESPNNEEEEVH